MTQIGFCKNCGQAVTIESKKELTKEQLIEEASYECNCDEARAMRKREEAKRVGQDSVQILFGNDMPELAAFLKDSVELLATGFIGKLSIDAGNGTQATLKATAKGTIRVTRIEKEKREME